MTAGNRGHFFHEQVEGVMSGGGCVRGGGVGVVENRWLRPRHAGHHSRFTAYRDDASGHLEMYGKGRLDMGGGVRLAHVTHEFIDVVDTLDVLKM